MDQNSCWEFSSKWPLPSFCILHTTNYGNTVLKDILPWATRMKKYLLVSLAILKNNLIREMEFRTNFLMWIFVQIAWVGLQIFIIQILFQYTESIHGWTKPEIFLLIGMFRVARGIFDFFIYANLTDLPDNINTGNLDYLLTRPVSPLYLASFRRHQYDQIGTFFSGIAFIIYAWQALGLSLNIVNLLRINILMVSGFFAFYSLILSVSTLSFFLTKLSAIGSFHDIVNATLRYPIDLLLGGNARVSLLLLPLAMIVTIPAKIMLGKVGPIFLFLELFSVLAFFLFAYRFWIFALRHYPSASS